MMARVSNKDCAKEQNYDANNDLPSHSCYFAGDRSLFCSMRVFETMSNGWPEIVMEINDWFHKPTVSRT